MTFQNLLLNPFFISLLFMAACSRSEQSSEIREFGENRSGNDITILQAWIGDNVVVAGSDGSGLTAKYRIDHVNCKEIERHTYSSASAGTYDDVTGDCSEALQNAAKLPNFSVGSPLLSPAIFRWEETSLRTYSQTGMCELVEFRTLIADEVISQPSFDGVGFFIGGGYYPDSASVLRIADC